MDTSLIDWFLQINANLGQFFHHYGFWAYGILFLVIFGETGFVFLPFLPGDSLLFAAGALAASGGADLFLLLLIITIAAILGNSVNFWIGRRVSKATTGDHFLHRFIKPHHLASAHVFFAKYGGWAITISRFLAGVRSVTPFVAGLGRMNFKAFSIYNIVGGIAWTLSFVLLGYFAGNLPIVKDNFHWLVLSILAFSLITLVLVIIRARWSNHKKSS